MDSLQPTPPISNPRHRRACRGVTLVEAAVVLAILAVLVCSAVPSFLGLIERQRLTGLAAQVAADVQFARSESVLRNEALRLSFYSAPWGTCYVVHSGARHQCSCAADASAAVCVADAVQVKTTLVPLSTGLRVQANVSSILFDPLHGTSTPTGTLKVLSAQAGAVHHVVNVLGRVRTCSPASTGPALPGYRAC